MKAPFRRIGRLDFPKGKNHLKLGMLTMTDLVLSLLCAAGFFLILLEDRFRLWATVACYGVTYLVSLGAGWIVSKVLGPSWAVAAGTLVLFLASLVLSKNNPLQKFYLVVLTLSCHFYLEAYIPLALGVMPFSTAGAFAGFFTLISQLLLAALVGLCLYRPFHHFSDRGPSAFLWGMCLIQLGLCAVANGKVDFLFRMHIPAERLFVSTAMFVAVIFVFRSVYQAGRFRQRATEEAARTAMLDMEAGDFTDLLAAVKEVKAARKAGEYALDTVNVMLQDGNGEMVPRYVSIFKKNGENVPILAAYNENPYLNAVIAAKAAFAAQNGISFESNAVTGSTPLSSVEMCVLVNDLLTRACLDAAAYDGDKRVRFTVFPGEDSLTLEAVYSGELPQQKGFSWKGKNLTQLLEWLFDEDAQNQDQLHGLENAQEIVGRYSGKLSVSGAPGEVILHMSLKF
jgi:hypothetical protein